MALEERFFAALQNDDGVKNDSLKNGCRVRTGLPHEMALSENDRNQEILKENFKKVFKMCEKI
ncbi:MAG: hypothetical protein V4642_00310 [Bacteroidota bacterium]